MIKERKHIWVVAAVVGVALVAVWFLALFQPQEKKLTSAHKAHAAAEQQVATLDGQVSQLRALLPKIPADEKDLSQLEAALPDNPELPSALTYLDQIAVQSGVTLSQVGPSLPTTRSSTASGSSQASTSSAPDITLSMSVSGTYGQTMTFLTDLAQVPRVFVVNTLGMTGGGSTSASVETSITAQMFYAGDPTP